MGDTSKKVSPPTKPVSTPCETGLHLNGDDCPSKDKRDPEVVRDYQACHGRISDVPVSAHSGGQLIYSQSDGTFSE